MVSSLRKDLSAYGFQSKKKRKEKFDDEATWWLYFILYRCIYVFTLSCLCHGCIFMVILRSTTGPYGRPMVEVAYGEMLYFTPPRLYGSWKLGKSGWGVDMMSPMFRHTRVNTSVGTVYIIFWVFIISKLIYIYSNLYVV